MTASHSNQSTSNTRGPEGAYGVPADPYKWTALGLTGLFVVTLPVILLLVVMAQPNTSGPVGSVSGGGVVSPVASGSDGNSDQLTIALGKATFQSTCAVCHGEQGEGLRNLGKPVRNSAFVQSQSDEELMRLIVEGRGVDDPLNTTGVLMPPRGAQGISDEKIEQVVAYMRSLQNPDEPTVAMDAWERGSEDGGGALGAIELSEHPGYDLYVSSCAACHGQGAEGLDQLGLPLHTSGFVRGSSDKDLITFIKMGRSSWDENNTTGLDMPPKGGNPAITDDQLQTIVDYLRAVQEQALGS